MPEIRPTVLPPVRGIRRELQYLYARRSTVSALIRSLEEYDRMRAPRMERGRRTVQTRRHSPKIA
jgi:hypothetical protein